MSLEGTWALCCSVGIVPHHPKFPSWILLVRPASEGGRKGGTAPTSQMPPTTASPSQLSAPPGPKGSWGWSWEGRTAPRSHSPRFGSLYEHDPPIRNQGLISQLTASSSIISIQTN